MNVLAPGECRHNDQAGTRSLKTPASPGASWGQVTLLICLFLCESRRARRSPARTGLRPRPRTGTRWVRTRCQAAAAPWVCPAERWARLTCCPLCLLRRRGPVPVDFTSACPQLTLSPLLRLRFVGLCLLSAHLSPSCVLTPPLVVFGLRPSSTEANEIPQTSQIVIQEL